MIYQYKLGNIYQKHVFVLLFLVGSVTSPNNINQLEEFSFCIIYNQLWFQQRLIHRIYLVPLGFSKMADCQPSISR